jgi:hypothetical protein
MLYVFRRGHVTSLISNGACRAGGGWVRGVGYGAGGSRVCACARGVRGVGYGTGYAVCMRWEGVVVIGRDVGRRVVGARLSHAVVCVGEWWFECGGRACVWYVTVEVGVCGCGVCSTGLARGVCDRRAR